MNDSQQTITHWDPELYRSAAGFVAGELGGDLFEWASQAVDWRGREVLDLGCGDGALSLRLQQSGAQLFGIDSSAEMIAAARSAGIDAEVFDAQALHSRPDLHARFDVVFTNAVLHWLPDHQAVIAGVHSVLKPGGVFVCECGGAGNVLAIRQAVEAATAERGVQPRFPWNFATSAAFEELLKAQGFRVQQVLSFPRRPVLPEGVAGWLETFGSSIVPELSATDRLAVWQRAQELSRAELFSDGQWHADYVRLRFAAVRE